MCGMTYSATPVSSSLDPFELKNEGADEMSDVRVDISGAITKSWNSVFKLWLCPII